MKNIFRIIAIALIGTFSCESFLEEENVPVATAQYLGTAAGYRDALTGAYSTLRTFYAGGEDGPSLTVFGTDEYTEGSDGGRKYLNRYDASLNPSAVDLLTVWQNIYRGINSTNIVIGRADEITGLDQSEIDGYVAEARFLRANYYFILVQLFGAVTISEEETAGAIVEAQRSSVTDVYNLIVSDLDLAVNNLPDIQSDYGRATKFAALHLRAKVHLTRATMDAGATANTEYTAALNDAETVITSGQFALLDDFASVFDQSGEVHNEVIWSIQYSQDELFGGGNSLHLYYLMQYDNQPGMLRDTENGRPFKRFAPTSYAANVFDKSIDSRYDKSFKTVFYCNRPGTYQITNELQDISVTLEEGDTAIWLPGYELDAAELATKQFQVLSPSRYTNRLYPTLTKFLDPNRPSVQHGAGSRDFIYMRLADTYLISAEANMMLGNMDEAVDRVNAVRRRAAFDGMEDAMEITTTDLDIDFILDERTRELLGEFHRWFDLVRTGKLLERVGLHNPDGSSNIQDYHVLRPIPQAQIDLTRNANGESYGQNTGY
ncbi:MAG: RagB/SusD family nutrient uptake outer membrane protein [Cyclobacteriaceae bacterium]